MLDIKLIRENPKLVKENIKKKFQNDKIPLVDEVKAKDEKWRKVKKEADDLRKERNIISEKINQAHKQRNQGLTNDLINKAKELPRKLAELEEEGRTLEKEIKEIMYKLPNIISKQTPIGKDASQNKEIRKWGKITKFKFLIKTHVELIEAADLADFNASARVSGNGFYYLKGGLALLDQALIRFAIDFMKNKKYVYIEPPLMMKKDVAAAAGDLKAFELALYKIDGEELYIIPTAEHAILGMLREKTIPEEKLPLKFFGYSMCMRKEIGAHGINEKGLWRTHQFNKVEQFVFCKPEDSERFYNELLKNSEEIIKKLKLPYRVLEMCSGDLGDWKYRSADIEVYRPTLKEYGEVGSLTNCTDYQARKLDIKCINQKGEKKVLHTLNNTALATSRIMVAIIENNQQKDGSIKIPAVLQKYMSGLKTIGGENGKRKNKRRN